MGLEKRGGGGGGVTNAPTKNIQLPLSFNCLTRKRMENLHKQYGPMVSVCLSGQGTWDVRFEGYDLIKEVLHDPRFSSRTNFELFDVLGNTKGIAFASGEPVKVKRKLTLQIMRALGVGKTAFSTGIEEVTNSLLIYLEQFENKNVYVQVLSNSARLPPPSPPSYFTVVCVFFLCVCVGGGGGRAVHYICPL